MSESPGNLNSRTYLVKTAFKAGWAARDAINVSAITAFAALGAGAGGIGVIAALLFFKWWTGQ